jgi:hypothetical protein
VTSPENNVPQAPRPQLTGRHRTEQPGWRPLAQQGPPPEAPPARAPQPAPPSEPPRPEPERFNGFVPRGQQPPAPAAEADSPATAPSGGTSGPAGSASELVEKLRALGEAQRVQSQSRWTRRRLTIAGAIAAGVVVVLIAGSIAGYRLLAPYYGLGYHAGGTAAIKSVNVTVTDIECGLSEPPFGNTGTPRGKYCGVTITAHNSSKFTTVFVDLRTWTSRLDVDLTVAPVASYLQAQRNYIDAGQSITFDLTYDVPDGARMLRVNPKIDNITRHISVS